MKKELVTTLDQRIKDPYWLYENYFKGSDSNITLNDLIRMRGMTLLINEGNSSGALLFGLIQANR